MKTNYLKNIFLIWSGIMIATSTAIFASNMQGVSIHADLVNLAQYLRELHITSDGTPNGNDVLSIAPDGEFQQRRGDAGFINSANFFGNAFVGATEISWNQAYLVWIQHPWFTMSVLWSVDFASGTSAYVWSRMDSSALWFTSQIWAPNATTQVRVASGEISFMFPNQSYLFPTTDGIYGQVLTTDGNGHLSRSDMWGASSSENAILTTGIFVSSDQLLNMGVNPIELIPSPGEGKYIQPIAVSIKFSPWLTPYTFAWHVVVFEWWSSSNYLYNFTADLSATESFIVNGGYNISTIAKLGEDEALKLSSIENSSPTGWDWVLEVFITYRIVKATTGI